MISFFLWIRSPSYNLSGRLTASSSPSRGALGIAVQFVLLTAAAWHTTRTKHCGTPEAPLLGELSNEVRLRGCTECNLPVIPPLPHCCLRSRLRGCTEGTPSLCKQHLPVCNLRGCTEQGLRSSFVFIQPLCLAYRSTPPLVGEALASRCSLCALRQ